VQFGEVDPEVGDLEEVLHLLAVGVGDPDVGRHHAEDHLALSRRLSGRVAALTDDVGYVGPGPPLHTGE